MKNLIRIHYTNNMVTEHENITDAFFVLRNILDIHNTKVSYVIADEQTANDLKCTALIHNQQTFKFGGKYGAWFDDENINDGHDYLHILFILIKLKITH